MAKRRRRRLYRAVQASEFQQIEETGFVEMPPEGHAQGNTGSKYFFIRKEDAIKFARGMFATFPQEGSYRIISVLEYVPRSSIKPIGGEGPAVIFDENSLPTDKVRIEEEIP